MSEPRCTGCGAFMPGREINTDSFHGGKLWHGRCWRTMTRFKPRPARLRRFAELAVPLLQIEVAKGGINADQAAAALRILEGR